MMWTWILGFLAISLLLWLYIRHNDTALNHITPEALVFSPARYTPDVARSAATRLTQQPISVLDQMPTKTGRRYIVVGGSGFIGGWIVLHLLQRGEDPKRIRILDIQAPARQDLLTGNAKDVQFLQVDVSDASAVEAAFQALWPSSAPGDTEPETTIFNTAANIRFFERHEALLSRSAKVNISGPKNIINASRSIGASVLVQTSSGSVAVRSNRFWLWPWEKEPKYFVQLIMNDDDSHVPKRHEDFFSNYAATKIVGERLVRKANGTRSGKGLLRTGCIRPCNGVYGPGGDILYGAYLVRQHSPYWNEKLIQNCTYVENCSLAHLCYEERLIDISKGSIAPDVSGQAFMITDPGPPPTNGDVYTVLETLDDQVSFSHQSPTVMLLIAQTIEFIHLARYFLGSSSFRILRVMSHIFPNLSGDIVNLQPSMFSLAQVHLIFDDSRARLPPAKGGLGYHGAYTTLEGLCKTVEEHQKSNGKEGYRSISVGFFLGWGQVRAKQAVEKAKKRLRVAQVLN